MRFNQKLLSQKLFKNPNKEVITCYESTDALYLINIIIEIENSMLNIAIVSNKLPTL